MNLPLQSFLTESLRVDRFETSIVVDNATTKANAKSILCSALETISKTKDDAAPHSPVRSRSKRQFRLPNSPHAPVYQQSCATRSHKPSLSPLRLPKHQASSSCSSPQIPRASPLDKSPSRWGGKSSRDSSTIGENERSPAPRLPRRVLSSQMMSPPKRKPSVSLLESIAALPFDDSSSNDNEDGDVISLSSPSSVCVRDFCKSRRQKSEEAEDCLSILMEASWDELTIFEDD